MNLTEAAHHVEISARALRKAVERSEVEAEHPLADSPWIFRRDHLDSPQVLEAVARIRQRRRNGPAVHDDGDLNLFSESNYPDGAV